MRNYEQHHYRFEITCYVKVRRKMYQDACVPTKICGKSYVLIVPFFNVFSLSNAAPSREIQFIELQIRRGKWQEAKCRIEPWRGSKSVTGWRARRTRCPMQSYANVRAAVWQHLRYFSFFLLGRPSFLRRLMDFNESRGMSATNEVKVVGRQTRAAAAAVKLENSRDSWGTEGKYLN